MKKRLIVIAFIFLLLLIIPFPRKIFSVECTQNYNNSDEAQLKQIIAACESKKNELHQKAGTLASEIEYMNTQINITELRIRETQQKIVKTQKEIEALSSKIEGLDTSLTYLSKLMLEKIVAGYKKRSISFLSLFFDSDNASDFLKRAKYLKTAEENNQKLLIQVQEAKLNFEEQKKLREEKKVELDNLNIILNQQNTLLASQKVQKQRLLADTQNDEAVYQRLLSQAQQQLASFKSFVQTSGADSIIAANGLGSGSDGNYYSQRDARWANQQIGYSSENILRVGCLLTSVSMLAKKNGQNVTPSDIALDTNRFWANTAWMRLPWPGVAGRSYTGVSDIDTELQNGNYVIAGVRITDCSNGGNHFVVLTKKDGDDYLMHDPIYGPDIKFNSHYSTICSSATFK